MTNQLRKLHWLDLIIVCAFTLLTAFIIYRINGALNYKWRWEIIPNYLIRWVEDENRWTPNILLEGMITTVRICIYSSVLAIVFGIILGLARCAENLTIRLLARTYLEFLRNIPPIVIIFIFFFFLSEQIVTAFNLEKWAREIAKQEDTAVWEFFFGDMRRFPSLISGVVVLALFESAFVGEIVRAGIQSVDFGQREAARSLGLNWISEMRFVVLPQALKKVVPPLANQFISLIKDSSIISLISVQELTYKATELVTSTRAIFETWLTVAGLYFIVCFSLSLVFRWLETRPNVPSAYN